MRHGGRASTIGADKSRRYGRRWRLFHWISLHRRDTDQLTKVFCHIGHNNGKRSVGAFLISRDDEGQTVLPSA